MEIIVKKDGEEKVVPFCCDEEVYYVDKTKKTWRIIHARICAIAITNIVNYRLSNGWYVTKEENVYHENERDTAVEEVYQHNSRGKYVKIIES